LHQNEDEKSTNFFVLLAFIISMIATLGSLFFSEVMQFIPCTLCWYQRILMYPLLIILIIKLLFPQEHFFKYAMTFAILGFIVSSYHNLVMFKIIPETLSPCVQGVPCSVAYINWLGFITIPMLSWVAFSMIVGILLLAKKGEFDDDKK
jgi:disulfide bond formation protein DsbB